MRLVVRVAVISAVLTCFLIGCIVYQLIFRPETQEEIEDEAARKLLEALTDNNPANEGLTELAQNSQPITLNIAVVLIVSLLTVSLLITGIIVIAVTMDPTNSNEPELFDSFPQSFSDSFDDTFGGDSTDGGGESEKRHWNPIDRHFPRERDIFPDFDIHIDEALPRRNSFSL